MAALQDDCLLCAMIKGQIPVLKVLETEKTLVFLDIGPVAEGHTLIVPKCEVLRMLAFCVMLMEGGGPDHCKTMDEVPDGYLMDILPLAKKVALALGIENYNVLQNNGRIAHQVSPLSLKEFAADGLSQHIFHVHFHLIPKPREKEGLGVGWPRVEPGLDALKKVHERVLSKL
ncbi:HIT-like protein [Punctularia strigosozonata HHB-11173 SS5]|uniref:HIT-like protein n=1 Tax=Punctularia strigosozonata (strain HHB-11173) TaxID=741275 RepID=UPI00044180E0|nr:HIT-like protein [Punctularia strigosozonata HHB-11173 SS5]EIN09692.1 HIT-like protein [Punctularia strigosozonata HHB-11173 SS5]